MPCPYPDEKRGLKSAAAFLFTLLAVLALQPPAAAQPQPDNGEPERVFVESADYMKHEKNTKITTLRGSVKVRINESTLEADEITLNENDNTAAAWGRVVLTDKKDVIAGSALYYDYDKEYFEMAEPEGSTTAEKVKGRVYYRGLRAVGTRKKIKIYKGWFTTCEPTCPVECHVQASQITIYTDIKIVSKNSYFYVGPRKVWFLPLHVISLKNKEQNLPEFGYSEIEGFYVKTKYPYMSRETVAGTALLDVMTKKGVRYGAIHDYISGRLGGKGHNYFLTNSEKDTGRVSTQIQQWQEFTLQKIKGRINYNRSSSYTTYRDSVRSSHSDLDLTMTREIRRTYAVPAPQPAPPQAAPQNAPQPAAPGPPHQMAPPGRPSQVAPPGRLQPPPPQTAPRRIAQRTDLPLASQLIDQLPIAGQPQPAPAREIPPPATTSIETPTPETAALTTSATETTQPSTSTQAATTQATPTQPTSATDTAAQAQQPQQPQQPQAPQQKQDSTKRSETLTYRTSSDHTFNENTNSAFNLQQRFYPAPRFEYQYALGINTRRNNPTPEDKEGALTTSFAKSSKLYSLNGRTDKKFDLDGDSFLQDNFYDASSVLPEVSVNFTPDALNWMIPVKNPATRPNISLGVTHGRFRRGPRSSSEIARTTTINNSLSRAFTFSKNVTLTPSQTLVQKFYHTHDADFTITHTAGLEWRFTQTTALNFNYTRSQGKGGIPAAADIHSETNSLSGNFNVNKSRTNFTLNTGYNYQYHLYDPLNATYRRDVSKNSSLNLRAGFDLETDIWAPTTADLTLKRKNLDLRIGTNWNTKELDLMNSSVTAGVTRNNGWRFTANGVYQDPRNGPFIRTWTATKTRCCSEVQFSYNADRDEYIMNFFILALPGERLGVTSTQQGFFVDESSFKTNFGGQQY